MLKSGRALYDGKPRAAPGKCVLLPVLLYYRTLAWILPLPGPPE